MSVKASQTAAPLWSGRSSAASTKGSRLVATSQPPSAIVMAMSITA